MTDVELIPPAGVARNYRHGYKTAGKYSPEYSVWVNMRARCNNPKNTRFKTYGARGIKVCPRWEEDFLNFLSDVGRRPTPDHSIDRIDNNGNYEPGNVKWSTRKEQCRNRSTSRLITFAGETKTLADWAEQTGLGMKLLHNRLSNGWSVRRALTEAPNGQARKSTRDGFKPATIHKHLPF